MPRSVKKGPIVASHLLAKIEKQKNLKNKKVDPNLVTQFYNYTYFC